MKEFIRLGFWFSITSISVNMFAIILAFIFADTLQFLMYFFTYSCFLTPILSFMLIFFSLFAAFLNKEVRKPLLINCLILLLGSSIPIILMFHIMFSGGWS
ncbi:hypothetical protein [Dysgonomonas alginatilytica]|uniref:hypothetical protein n=1 Tax=Dysgonomonas alginatilytica TaxID=1605892 RepID=UPI000D762A5C|nr:hypothetical protein [Dysgonomonas alginatilytica]